MCFYQQSNELQISINKDGYWENLEFFKYRCLKCDLGSDLNNLKIRKPVQ